MTFSILPSDVQLAVDVAPDVTLFGLIRRHERPVAPGLVVLIHGRLHRHDRGPPAELAASGRLPFDLFLLDLRGCGRSTGVTGYANATEEAEDLHVVIEHLRTQGESVVALIGHSKGASVAFNYVAAHPSSCRFIVSLSGRYSSEGHDSSARFTEAQRRELAETGRMTWLNYRAGIDNQERRPYVVTAEALAMHAKASLAPSLTKLPSTSHVLVLHGLADGTVASRNAEQIHADLKKAGIAADLFLLDGVAHNYDAPGEADLLAGIIGSWLVARSSMAPADPKRGMIDHLNRTASLVLG